MLTLEPNSIQDTYDNMTKFGKQNFGAKNGEDFCVVAQTFFETKAGKDLCSQAAVLGMLGSLLLPKTEGLSEAEKKETMTKVLNESPVRTVIADCFYLGYKLGQQAAEVERLDKIAGA